MPHLDPIDDEFDDFDDDAFDDGDSETIICSSCRAEIYEDAVQCPHCGMYVIADTHPLRGRSATWVAMGLFGIVAVIVALLFCF